MNKTRQEILEKLKKASSIKNLPEEPDLISPIYFPVQGNLAEIFKKNVELISGNVLIFNSEDELFQSLKQKIETEHLKTVSCLETAIQEKLTKKNIPFSSEQELPENMEAGITGCEFLVAHTGSAIVSSAQGGGRRMFVFPPIHIIIATENQLVDYLETAYLKIIDKYGKNLPSLISVITGPSRTADIEKTLVLGAHGPKELYIFVLKK